jgi:two-component system, OmpR family, KDP operon response regulator KdpE
MKLHPTALIIDGELAVRRLVRILLEEERYKVIGVETGRKGLEAAVEQQPDVIVLELDLPDTDGLIVLRRIREWSQKPVLILSERTSAADKVSAFDCGADDYVTKPFDNVELLARLRVIQRRWPGVPDSPLLIEGDLIVNLASHEVTLRGQKLDFTPTEEALFYLLARHAGKTVTCKHIVRCIWGTDEHDKIRDVRVYVTYLRRKLGVYGGEILIKTEDGIGYRLSLANRQEHTGVAVAC